MNLCECQVHCFNQLSPQMCVWMFGRVGWGTPQQQLITMQIT